MVSQAKHARAREVFLEAVDLPAADLAIYLDQACNRDTELREEVESLLAHHNPDSIFEQAPTERTAADGARVLPVDQNSKTSRISRWFGTRKARLIWTLVAATTLIVIGYVTHARIKNAILGVRETELSTVLDSAAQSLELWIGDQKAQLDFLTGDSAFVDSALELLATADQGADKIEAWNRSPLRDELLEKERFFMAITGAAGFAIISDRGELVFTSSELDTGLVLTEKVSGQFSAALRGDKVFVRPHRFDDLVEREAGGTMYSLVLGPLRDEESRVAAVIANVHRAFGPGSISNILEVSRLGETGETYALDADGLMLSASRFTEELRRSGHVPTVEDEGREWEATAQLNVQVRDPGGDLIRGHDPELELAARPLTRLAALAIAARTKSDPGALQGVLLEPYRNYRGAEVIGAWRWLAEHGFAVATEMEAEEALAPLVYVEITFGALLALLTVLVAAALVSTFSAARLRNRVRELKELGPYQLGKPIAEGGMGIVYSAEHALLRRRTAVKVLSGEVSKQSIARFEREVSLASSLTHPNTIEIYDYGRTPEGVFYCAMEFVEGPTLSALVTSFGPPSPERVVYILKQACASLGEAHREGLVHRDIKPQNIMLCTRGGEHDVVKVLDFGLAKDVASADSGELSRGIHIGGTPLYMAPERLTSPKLLDARVDIYSLGCVAYYLLSGKPVFEPIDDLDLLDKIVNAEPRPLHEICSQPVPEALAQLVTDCLEKDSQDRPPSVFAILDRLESLDGVGQWAQEDAAQWWKQAYSNPRPD